jgi:ATP-binding cassette subfamily B protein/subfamily B ATP-binding cassette protein MsbA
MKNFRRVLALASRYRGTVIAAILCAVAVGVLWGANIGTVYPFAEVIFRGNSLDVWVDSKIQQARNSYPQRLVEIERLRRQLAAAPPHAQRAVRLKVEQAICEFEAVQKAERGYLRARPFVVRYLPKDPFQTLCVLIVFLLVGTLLKSLFVFAHWILVTRVSQLGTYELRKLFFRRTLRMDVATFGSEGISDLMARFTHDSQNVAMGLKAILGKAVREPLKMAACLVGAAVISWRLLLLSLVIAPLAVILMRWLARMLKRTNRRAMEEMARLYENLEEAFRGIKVVKSFTMERQERNRFHHNSKQYYRKAMRIAKYDALAHPLTETLGILIIGMALLSGAWLVLKGETHLLGIRMSTRPFDQGTLILFYCFLAGTADPARKLSDVFTQIQRAAAASDRIYAMLDREPRVRDPKRPRPLPRHHRHLVFDRVDFAYVPGRPVLQDVDLRIEFGETIAIVGPSGCGKSSLVSLVPRFADPDEGTIRLDGVPLGEVRLRDLRGQIGVVTQDPVLFDDTVLNNIRYGSTRATREEVVRAAKQAHAHRFIEQELAQGYETLLGPMGGQLSGGQRQRIALARAILRDPAILILDEATSQIDLESEQLIQKALERFVRGRTALIVTHRLGTISLADRIVVMGEGRIVDVGTHDQLTARCTFYRRLYQIQFEGLRDIA